MKSSLSTDSKSTKVNDPVKRAFARLCRLADTPLSRSFNRNDDARLVEQLSIDPRSYHDADSFRTDYLLVSFLSKYKGLNTGIDTKKVALAGFATGESVCKKTNARFRENRATVVDPILFRAQQLLAKLLGVFDISLLDGRERWGPGATTDLKRQNAYLDTKLAKLPLPVTAECLPLFRRAIQSDLHWSELILGHFPEGPFSLLKENFEVVFGSSITTVPKNAKTDRTIAIEPRGNMFMQKSAGSYIRHRLKRFGVDLDNQGLNQDLAKKALDLDLATIDLSMASDTIANNLVRDLLPFEWYEYLDSVRSKLYECEKVISRFEKFSSMGNGFTFELESAIFWALTKASMEVETEYFAIYGDDIILPCSDAHVLIMVLSYCGFSTNVDKTFVEGPFRESCGRHFFNGEEVTPIYQKEIVTCIESHIRFCNRLKRYAVKYNDGDHLHYVVNSTWRKEYESIRGWRPLIPAGTEGDNGYMVCHDDEFPPLKAKTQSYGHQWSVLVKRVVSIPADERALLAYALRLGSSDQTEYDPRRLSTLEWPETVFSIPSYGNVDSRDEHAVTLTRVTRWIEPSWEFALDSR